jgi:hypothetical protein
MEEILTESELKEVQWAAMSKKELIDTIRQLDKLVEEQSNRIFNFDKDYVPSRRLQRKLVKTEGHVKAYEAAMNNLGGVHEEFVNLYRAHEALLDANRVLQKQDPIHAQDEHVSYFINLVKEERIRSRAMEVKLKAFGEYKVGVTPVKKVVIESKSVVKAPDFKYPEIKSNEIMGNVFGEITPLNPVSHGKKSDTYRCLCSCGNMLHVTGRDLLAGKKSCGCTRWRKPSVQDMRSEYYRYWEAAISHQAPMVNRWRARVCDFIAWCKENVGDRPGKDYSLSLIDPLGMWEPGNVSWAERSHAHLGGEPILKKKVFVSGYYEENP